MFTRGQKRRDPSLRRVRQNSPVRTRRTRLRRETTRSGAVPCRIQFVFHIDIDGNLSRAALAEGNCVRAHVAAAAAAAAEAVATVAAAVATVVAAAAADGTMVAAADGTDRSRGLETTRLLAPPREKRCASTDGTNVEMARNRRPPRASRFCRENSHMRRLTRRL